MSAYLRLLRPRHWIKNVFVPAPLLFALAFDRHRIIDVLLATAAFCLVSSVVYIVNDIVDREADRQHPTKRHRPIAAGTIGAGTAGVVAAVLLAGAVALGLSVGPLTLLVIGLYAAVNLLYSLVVKHIAVLDVMSIAAGFILRIVAGAVAAAVELSHWMILITFFLSLFLGFCKRKQELSFEEPRSSRGVLVHYEAQAVGLLIAISTALTVVMYTMYTIDAAVVARFGTGALVYTVPVVVFGLLRYLTLVFAADQGGDVADTILGDAGVLLTAVVWLAAVIAIMVVGGG